MVFEPLSRWWQPPVIASEPVSDFEPLPFTELLFRAPVKLLTYHLYHIITSLRSSPSTSDMPIRVVCISDTHNNIPKNVPDGDILIHAGDMTNDGSVEEIQAQVNWLASLSHKEIVVIAGNHDTFMDPRTRPSLSENQRNGSVDWKRVHYLQHRQLTLTIPIEPKDGFAHSETHLLASSRRVRLYGAPQIPACGPMSVHAFQYPRGRDAWSETVPEDTDILVTHTPPKFHRDLPLPNGMGCEHLMAEVRRVKPALHVFGHVHWGAGRSVIWWGGCHDAYEFGMSTESRWTRGFLNPWLWWNVVRVAYRGLRELIWDRIWGGQGSNTIMVNAAQMHGNTSKLGNPVQVVNI